MARRILKRLSFANVLAVIAIFVAIGGSAYAGAKISGKLIKKNSVTAAKLKCPGTAPTRTGAICYGAAQPASGWINAAQNGCRSQGLRLPSDGEAVLLIAAVGGETWADDVIVEGAGGSAARVQGGTIFSTAIADPHSYRCVTTAA
jgi:Tfp pilus tip-associated adhesin PilY1